MQLVCHLQQRQVNIKGVMMSHIRQCQASIRESMRHKVCNNHPPLLFTVRQEHCCSQCADETGVQWRYQGCMHCPEAAAHTVHNAATSTDSD